MRGLRWGLCLSLACPAIALARGRKPEGTDGFPDYNRLEMHRKTPNPAEAPPPIASTATASAPALPALPPGLNTPVNPSSDEDEPKPPPKAVPVSDNASEPPMPDELKDTLVPSTTETYVPFSTGTLIPFATGQK